MSEKTITREALKLRLKCGQGNGKDARTLAYEVGTTERAIRQLVDDLIEAGTPVCAHPTTGYYIAETLAEVEAACTFLHGRAVHTLGKISKLRTAFARFTGVDGADEPLPEL